MSKYSVGRAYSDDETVGIHVFFLGDGYGSVAVSAGGDITFYDCGSADTTVNTTGTIDCSTPPAASNTIGEVVDIINASENWKAIMVGCLRSDSSDNVFDTLTTTVVPIDGLGLKLDTSVALHQSVGITHQWKNADDKGYANEFINARIKPTYNAGTTYFKIYACPDAFPDQSEYILWSQTATATTAQQLIPANGVPLSVPVRAENCRLVARVYNASTLSCEMAVVGRSRTLSEVYRT